MVHTSLLGQRRPQHKVSECLFRPRRESRSRLSIMLTAPGVACTAQLEEEAKKDEAHEVKIRASEEAARKQQGKASGGGTSSGGASSSSPAETGSSSQSNFRWCSTFSS